MEPESEGNIGGVARVMKNFGFNNLWLINPKTEIGKKAKTFAMHAEDVLSEAKIVKNINSATKGCSYLAGTSSISAKSSSNLLRISITPEIFAKRIANIKGEVGLIFGRESRGLSNKELEKSDLILNIPTDSRYRALNIVNATAIILYELFKINFSLNEFYINEALPRERSRIIELFNQIIMKTDMVEYKQKMTHQAFMNLISRSLASSREVTILTGAFRKISYLLKKANVKK
jgi:TrmH family RNA methyltransferase